MAAEPDAVPAKRAMIFWVVAFFVATFGTAAFLKSTQIVPKPWSMALMILPMLLLFPLVRSSEALQRQTGCESAVTKRYNRRVLIASFAYVIGLGVALTLFREREVTKPVAALLSLLPTLPVFAMIWAMGRYILEEKDEYLRARLTNAALIATGILLTVSTFWGFLTTFEVTAAVPLWTAVPIWFFGLGLAQIFNKARGA